MQRDTNQQHRTGNNQHHLVNNREDKKHCGEVVRILVWASYEQAPAAGFVSVAFRIWALPVYKSKQCCTTVQNTPNTDAPILHWCVLWFAPVHRICEVVIRERNRVIKVLLWISPARLSYEQFTFRTFRVWKVNHDTTPPFYSPKITNQTKLIRKIKTLTWVRSLLLTWRGQEDHLYCSRTPGGSKAL